jgi:hypothetical protein
MRTKSFTVEIDGESKKFVVKSPSIEDQREAQKVYNQAFTDAIKSKSVVRARLDDLLKDQGLWDDEKQVKLTQLQEIVTAAEKTLAKGGIPLRKAKEVALDMQKTRLEMRNLLAARTSLDNHSAEGQADNARFNYLVSSCVVYKDSDKKYFDNLKAYLENADDLVAIEGAQALANMLYGLDNDFEKNLPENKFLRQYKFVDEDLRFINKEGSFVDSEGRLVNEKGQYINDAGDRVDRFGNLLDEEGEMIVESKPFLDDDGEPVILEDKKEKEDKEDKKDAKKESTTTESTS